MATTAKAAVAGAAGAEAAGAGSTESASKRTRESGICVRVCHVLTITDAWPVVLPVDDPQGPDPQKKLNCLAASMKLLQQDGVILRGGDAHIVQIMAGTEQFSRQRAAKTLARSVSMSTPAAGAQQSA
eukprot:1469605-Rhodomonas_salina.3